MIVQVWGIIGDMVGGSCIGKPLMRKVSINIHSSWFAKMWIFLTVINGWEAFLDGLKFTMSKDYL